MRSSRRSHSIRSNRTNSPRRRWCDEPKDRKQREFRRRSPRCRRAQPRFSGPDRDGRALDVDWCKVAVRTQAAEIAGQQVEKATALASDVVDAAASEARKQGLTPDGAKAAAEDIKGRVGRVVDAAKNVGGKQF